MTVLIDAQHTDSAFITRKPFVTDRIVTTLVRVKRSLDSRQHDLLPRLSTVCHLLHPSGLREIHPFLTVGEAGTVFVDQITRNLAVFFADVTHEVSFGGTLAALTGVASRGSAGTPVDSDGWDCTVSNPTPLQEVPRLGIPLRRGSVGFGGTSIGFHRDPVR